MAKAKTLLTAKTAAPSGPDAAQIEDFLRTRAENYLAIPNVIGVSVARKQRDGQATDELAVVFDVSAKLTDPGQIAAAGSTPLPASIEIGGFTLPTDVVQNWYVPHAGSVRPGASIGNAGGTTGSLGAIVRQRGGLRGVGLSNWHVLANPPSESVVLQPGLSDGGDPGHDRIGQVLDQQLGGIDAALTSLEGRAIDPAIPGLGVRVESYRKPASGDRVVKFGKTTGVTYGRIAIASKPISFRHSGQQLASTINSVTIAVDPDWALSRAPLCAGGDSGSAWMYVNDAGTVTSAMVALHWGLEGATGNALACSAIDVATRFELIDGAAEVAGFDADDAAPPVVVAGDRGAPPAPGQPHRVTARDGLLLRTLRSDTATKIGSRPWNALVHVIARYDGWAQVDLEGDGKADGFMSLDYLQPGAAPLPDLPPRFPLDSLPSAQAIDKVTAAMVYRMFPSLPAVRNAIDRHLPDVLSGLRGAGLLDRDMVLMALATIRAESEGFRPISEGSSKYNSLHQPFDAYEPPRDKAVDLGNTRTGDGSLFKGRGFVQLTGRWNYTSVGDLLAIPLEASPELANDSGVAGRILATFLKRAENKIRPALAERSEPGLKRARRAVNGGTHGFDRFQDAWNRGLALLA